MNVRTVLAFITLILSVAVSLVIYNRSRSLLPAAKENVAVARETQKAVENQTLPVGGASSGTSQVDLAKLTWGRDPFLTPKRVSEATGQIEVGSGWGPAFAPTEVSSIIVGGGQAVATVGGNVVGVGDRIGEEVVMEIRATEVVLGRGAEKRVIKLREPAVSIKVRKMGDG